MGFIEVLGRLPRVFSALRELTDAARAERPDVAVVIDYPDFHFRLARRLKLLGVPVVYYIPPKVWVWRKKRVRALRDSFVRILSILPFEVDFYARENLPVVYVGSPLADELPLKLSREDARVGLGIAAGASVLVVMPGSRPSELKMHLEVMLDAANRAAAILRSSGKLGAQERLVTLLPFPVTSDLAPLQERVEQWLRLASGGNPSFILDVRVSQGNADLCMVAADAGLIKSGTSTLEAALLGCPHVIVYRTGRVSAWLYKSVVRYKGPVGLSNLVAAATKGEPLLVREILLTDVTVKALCDEVVELFSDAAKREGLKAGFAKIRALMIGADGEKGPSHRAALEILDVIRKAQRRSG
jgi:lipid-A-disaccharide synthase